MRKNVLIGALFALAAVPVMAAAVTFSTVESYVVACGTSATSVVSPEGSLEVRCQVETSADTVYFGGSDVTTANGYPVGSDGNDGSALSVNGRVGYCVAASSTNVRCISGR